MVKIAKKGTKSILASKFFTINFIQTPSKSMIEFGVPQGKLKYWVFSDIEEMKKTNFDLAHILSGMEEDGIRILLRILEQNPYEEVAEDLASIFLELRNNC